MNKKSIVLMVAGGGCFLVFAFFVLGGLGLLYVGGAQADRLSDEPLIANVSVQLDDIIHTQVGDDFILAIDVTNYGTDIRNLDSIDMETTYLEGVEVNKAEPRFQGFEHVVFMSEDFSTYDFQRDLTANSTQTIKFYMTAAKAGTYTGYVDVCIDSAIDCNRYEATIVVEE